MSWSRRSLILTLPLALAACGFAPAYGTKGTAESLVGTVRAADPTDKNSFDFVQHVEERLGRPTKPAYALAYTITTAAIGAGITPDGAITRYNVKGGLDWTLTRLSDQARMTGGHIDAFTSYSATGSTVAGQTAQMDANLRLMRLLGDDLVMRLIAASTSFAP
jgi:LPS-assembly lipoprotein